MQCVGNIVIFFRVCMLIFIQAYKSDTFTSSLPTIRYLGIEPIKFSDAIGNIMPSMRKSGPYIEKPEDFFMPKPISQEFGLSYNVSPISDVIIKNS